MSHLLLWLYLALGISSAFLVFAWIKVAGSIIKERRLEGNSDSLIWSKSFLVSTGLAINALAAFFGTFSTAYDVFVDPLDHLHSVEPFYLAYFLFTILLSKVILVWAVTTEEIRKKIRWPWTVYVAVLVSITIAVSFRVFL